MDRRDHGDRVCWLNRAATGVGKTYMTANAIARYGVSTIWLAPRHDLLDETEELLLSFGASVARMPRLTDQTCVCPELIEAIRAKGYNYRSVWCMPRCSMMARNGTAQCPFLCAFRGLDDAAVLLAPHVFHERAGKFYCKYGNTHRPLVVFDEDAVSSLLPTRTFSRQDLLDYRDRLRQLARSFSVDSPERRAIGRQLGLVNWMRYEIDQVPSSGPAAFAELPEPKAVSPEAPDASTRVQAALFETVQRTIRSDSDSDAMTQHPPHLWPDLDELEAARPLVHVWRNGVAWHIRRPWPDGKRVLVLDASGSPAVLASASGRRVEPLHLPVITRGQVVQIMDGNFARGTVRRQIESGRLLRLLDAIAAKHQGQLALLTYMASEEALREKLAQPGRWALGHFGAHRGTNSYAEVDVLVVLGTPRPNPTAIAALAVGLYGRAVLDEELQAPAWQPLTRLIDGPERWLVRTTGHRDKRMATVYEYFVAGELLQALGRARAISRACTVYLITNEPVALPGVRIKRCFAADVLPVAHSAGCAQYEATAQRLLDSGQAVTNASVTRAAGVAERSGRRYWCKFLEQWGDALRGDGNGAYRWREE